MSLAPNSCRRYEDNSADCATCKMEGSEIGRILECLPEEDCELDRVGCQQWSCSGCDNCHEGEDCEYGVALPYRPVLLTHQRLLIAYIVGCIPEGHLGRHLAEAPE